MFSENAVAFLSDFGVSVTFTGAPAGTLGIVEHVDEERLSHDGNGVILVRVRQLLITSSVAALLSDGDAITVGGTAYVAREPVAVGDGAFSVVGLRNA